MVCCKGFNDQGEPMICFCFSRQVIGCDRPDMEVVSVSESKDELVEYVRNGLIWQVIAVERTLDEVTAYVKKTMKECTTHDCCGEDGCPMFRLEQILGLRG